MLGQHPTLTQVGSDLLGIPYHMLSDQRMLKCGVRVQVIIHLRFLEKKKMDDFLVTLGNPRCPTVGKPRRPGRVHRHRPNMAGLLTSERDVTDLLFWLLLI